MSSWQQCDVSVRCAIQGWVDSTRVKGETIIKSKKKVQLQTRCSGKRIKYKNRINSDFTTL